MSFFFDVLNILNNKLSSKIDKEISRTIYEESFYKPYPNYTPDRIYYLIQLFSNFNYPSISKDTKNLHRYIKESFTKGGKNDANSILEEWIKDGDKFKQFSKGLSDGEKEAVLNALSNKNIPINDINKIPNFLYNQLKEIIDSFSKKDKSPKKSTTTNSKFITQPPVRPSNVFEGREDDISKILKLSESDKIALVNGIGGIGKTTICRYIFWDIADNGSEDTTTLAWITYNESLISSFYLAFEGINSDNPDDYYLQAQHMINQYGTKLLLFIDNANDISDEEIQEIRKFSCKVIITSRSKLDSIETYFVDHLNEDTCILIYKKYSGDSKDESNEYIKEIVKLADYHTITIELIAKIQKANHKNAKQMLDTLSEKGFNLENITSKVSVDNGSDKAKFNEHMAKLFDISNITDEEEKRELGLFSLLEANLPVDFDTIAQLFKKSENDDTDFNNEPLNELINKGWLSVTEDNDKVFMHPVISDVVRQLLSPKFEDCKDFIVALNKIITNSIDNDYITNNTNLSHAVKVSYYFDNIKNKNIYVLLDNVGYLYDKLANYNNALEYYYKVLNILDELYETEHSDTAIIYNNIGGVYKSQGDYEKALEFFNRALSIREKHFGTEHLNTASLYNNIGTVYNSQGDYEKALEFFNRALPIHEKHFGTKHPDTAIIYKGIGDVYHSQGDYEKALEFFNRALPILEKYFGTEHPNTASLYNNIGDVYNSQSDYEKALEFYIKANYDNFKST